MCITLFQMIFVFNFIFESNFGFKVNEMDIYIYISYLNGMDSHFIQWMDNSLHPVLSVLKN